MKPSQRFSKQLAEPGGGEAVVQGDEAAPRAQSPPPFRGALRPHGGAETSPGGIGPEGA